MVHGYPGPGGNPDESTLTSGFSIDRPMFSDSTTVTSGESPAFFGHSYQAGFRTTLQGQQMPLKEYNEKTTSVESDATTYV